MKNFRKDGSIYWTNIKILANNVFVFFSSVKLAVVLLLALFAITLIGTLYQADFGLYAAQQRYFYQWFFWGFGFLPLPAAKTLLVLFSINLACAAYSRYKFRLSKLGIVLIHYGILFLMIGAVISHYLGQESFISLKEGDKTTFSEDYYVSELVIWKEKRAKDGLVEQKGQAYSLKKMPNINSPIDETIFFSDFNLALRPIYFFPNASPAPFLEDGIESASGLKAINFKKMPVQREQSLPGGVFELRADYLQDPKVVLLWEGELSPYTLETPSGTLYMKIRRKRYVLPFEIELKKFKRETYYASDIPKEFESEVDIIKNNLKLPARIYMNNPLRTDGYTLFQASFAIDEQGSKRSIFATVENFGYLLPYISSIIIALGLFYHFVYMMIIRVKRRNARLTKV